MKPPAFILKVTGGGDDVRQLSPSDVLATSLQLSRQITLLCLIIYRITFKTASYGTPERTQYY